MSLLNSFCLFFFSSVLSWLGLGLVMPFLRRSMMDNPNLRSSHILPIPRGGGVSFVLVGSIMHLIWYKEMSRWIPVMCIPLAVVGMIDDYKDTPVIWRYFAQFITATVLILVGKISFSFIGFIILAVAVTAIINFSNFMDGLDGLIAGCGIVLMAATSSWALAGALFGFIIWNWSPARVFMGDVGSTFIGSVFAGLVLQEDSEAKMVQTLLIGFPIFADALITVLRRIFAGEEPLKAHRQHLFQRLNQAGWTHQSVASLYIIGMSWLLVARILGGTNLLLITVVIQFFIGLYLESKVAVKFTRRT